MIGKGYNHCIEMRSPLPLSLRFRDEQMANIRQGFIPPAMESTNGSAISKEKLSTYTGAGRGARRRKCSLFVTVKVGGWHRECGCR